MAHLITLGYAEDDVDAAAALDILAVELGSWDDPGAEIVVRSISALSTELISDHMRSFLRLF